MERSGQLHAILQIMYNRRKDICIEKKPLSVTFMKSQSSKGVVVT